MGVTEEEFDWWEQPFNTQQQTHPPLGQGLIFSQAFLCYLWAIMSRRGQSLTPPLTLILQAENTAHVRTDE